MNTSKDVQNWLAWAEKDLKIARLVLEEFPEDAVFHCQQAAEKALKAVYIKKFEDLVKTHELKFLAEKVSAPAEIAEICDALTEFFISARYPDLEESVSESSARQAISAAEKVVEWSKKN